MPRVESATDPVRIGIIGKYVNLPDAYLSVVESLRHAGFHHGAGVEIDWIQAEQVDGLLAEGRLRDLDGIVIPGGFGERGIEGKIAAAGYAREHDIPCLGLCLGLQVMVIDFARDVVGLERANSSEFDPLAPHPVIDLMDAQQTSPTWAAPCAWAPTSASSRPGSQVAAIYGASVVSERHRHRYEVNTRFRSRFEEAGLRVLGHLARRPAGRVHRAARATPSGSAPRPTRSSRAVPTGPHPLFRELVAAALARAEGRNPT